MLHTHKSLYDRSLEKTQEQVFINSLRKEFELSPAESQGVLDLAQRCLFGEVPSAVGVIRFICASEKAKHGKPLKDLDLLEVSITLDNGVDDLNVLRDQGSEALRQLKIMRLTEETYEQGGLLTQEDLGRLLQVSSRTIRKDMKDLQKDGNTLHTRGNDQDIGPGVSHKTNIIDLYLSGLTYHEIMRKTRHSAFAIKRYVSTFGRMLIMLNKGLTKVAEISRLLGCSERLTKEYLVLFKKHKQGDHWPPVYLELIDQLQAMYPAKKKDWGTTMKAERKDRYASIPKRSFRNSIVHHLEHNYKLVGSHKVIQMMADDIMDLHKEYYPETSTVGSGHVVWQTTSATEKKPSYGKHVEDQKIKTVILPLITPEDVEYRMRSHYHVENKGNNHAKQAERDVEVLARLVKSAFKQGGLLTGAELSVLMNRSLNTIGRYLKMYHETHDDILPTKGIILDQGSRPTHKAPIVNLYEQGIPDPDIARLTNHTIESVGHYLRAYRNVKMMMDKGFNLIEMVRVSGKSRSTILQYRELVYQYHPDLKCTEKNSEENK